MTDGKKAIFEQNSSKLLKHPVEQLSLKCLSLADEPCSKNSCGCKKNLKRSERNDATCFDIFSENGPKRFCSENYFQLGVNRIKSINHPKKCLKTRKSNIDFMRNVSSGDFKVFGKLEEFCNFENIAISAPDDQKLSNTFGGKNFREFREDLSNTIKFVANGTKDLNFLNCTDEQNLQRADNSVLPSCSREALSSCSDDWTIHELSSYFEYFCHIPKNMSDMAKMMYT